MGRLTGSYPASDARSVSISRLLGSLLLTICESPATRRANRKVTVDDRWDEKAGLRTGCGVRSQVIDVLKAQIKRRPAMKKVSIVAAQRSAKISRQKLTVGLDLGDRSSWYCVLDETGQTVLEQKLSTTPKAMQEVFGAM